MIHVTFNTWIRTWQINEMNKLISIGLFTQHSTETALTRVVHGQAEGGYTHNVRSQYRIRHCRSRNSSRSSGKMIWCQGYGLSVAQKMFMWWL